MLCSWLLDHSRIAQVSRVLADIENDFRKATHVTGEIKGSDIVRTFQSERNSPEYINKANKALLHDLIRCLAENDAKIVARAFAKRLHAKYERENLYFFAHLTLFEQIYLLRNHLNARSGDLNPPNLPISIIADTLPSNKVFSSRQAITNAVKEIERQTQDTFPLLWSFDLSVENAFIRVADILGRILFAIAHNRWSQEIGREKLYPQIDELGYDLKALFFGVRTDAQLKSFQDRDEQNLFRVRWYPAPYHDLR